MNLHLIKYSIWLIYSTKQQIPFCEVQLSRVSNNSVTYVLFLDDMMTWPMKKKKKGGGRRAEFSLRTVFRNLKDDAISAVNKSMYFIFRNLGKLVIGTIL